MAASGYVEAYVGADPNLALGCYLVDLVEVESPNNVTISSDRSCGPQYWSGAIHLPQAGTYQVSAAAANIT